ncbi:MAG: hypothetical protein QM594_08335 [Niabella sp.]
MWVADATINQPLQGAVVVLKESRKRIGWRSSPKGDKIEKYPADSHEEVRVVREIG